jgi:uncharacterized protein (DUF58 family)
MTATTADRDAATARGRVELTGRGKVFLAVGGVALLLGTLGGGNAWQHLGVLLVTVPPVAVLLVRRLPLRLQAARSVVPARVTVGEEASVTLDLRGSAAVPAGLLRLEDVVPRGAGSRPRFVLDRGGRQWRRRVRYRRVLPRRGVAHLGPLVLHAEDPFGCSRIRHLLSGATAVTVVPRVHRLEPIRLPTAAIGSGGASARTVAAAGEEDVAIRPYAQGDDRRRVHWRATARHDELMVRHEEVPWHSRATVLLDTRSYAHVGRSDAGDARQASFEWAVEAAASIAVHLSTHGYAVDLVTDDVASGPRDDATHPWQGSEAMLGALATVQPTAAATVARMAPMLRHTRTSDGVLIAVLGRIDDEEVATVARLRQDAGAAAAMLLDVATWQGLPAGGAARAATALRRAGWSVVEVTRDSDIRAAWSALSQLAEPGRAAAAAGSTPEPPMAPAEVGAR